ncbi:MAG: sulfocyanin-like copper-binding protein [Gemmatimonadota bacterium]|nr:sulfocyanin-like copper-binding protein [Gemmatimonadota bacterium]MDH5758875.1 sulfocyanin-like copper-binding protein [Gemmatimonadota bacterium]
MKRISLFGTVLALAACGGGEPAQEMDHDMATMTAEAPASGTVSAEMTTPEWLHVDHEARTVHMTITAGATEAKAYWNFNGGYDGNMTITVPEGYAVTIDFENNDPVMAHSMGIVAAAASFGAMLEPTSVFEGALTQNPTSMTDATMPGEKERVTFTAAAAGEYTMVCYIPGHAATGMWVRFNVSAEGEAGVQGGM